MAMEISVIAVTKIILVALVRLLVTDLNDEYLFKYYIEWIKTSVLALIIIYLKLKIKPITHFNILKE